VPSLPRQLRSNSTDAERVLWQALRNRQLGGFKFRRQHPIPPYIVDFVCLEQRLIVELDGGQHAETRTYDEVRTSALEPAGYKVMRFWNNEFLNNRDAALEQVLRTLSALGEQQ
jgi:very-short-patch-repair endonuclease